MMEAFGKNLQRKTLYDEFFKCKEDINVLATKGVSAQLDMISKSQHATNTMVKIMKVTSADSSNLKNEHNQLFLSLMERLEYLK